MFGLRIKVLKADARVLGLVLPMGHEFDLDILPEQAKAIQDAVAAGMIEVLKGAEALPAPVAVDPPKADKGKGK